MESFHSVVPTREEATDSAARKGKGKGRGRGKGKDRDKDQVLA
jgi:hypothetical protein